MKRASNFTQINFHTKFRTKNATEETSFSNRSNLYYPVGSFRACVSARVCIDQWFKNALRANNTASTTCTR